jgi:hypothetical protein
VYRIFLCLALVVTGIACAPKLLGPTGPSGYFFSLSVSTSNIWLAPAGLIPSERLPTFAELSVQVRDAQGQPVDGVPVEFQVEPAWTNSASLEPSRTITRGGVAQTIFRAQTTGAVRIIARVEDTVRETRIAVSVWSPPTGSWRGQGILTAVQIPVPSPSDSR